MKVRAKYFGILSVLFLFIFEGCYTQLKLEDDDYTYRKEVRKKVVIKDDEDRSYESDTVYESTDDKAYEEEEETYYYPRHRRAYKYYYPGITIVVGGGLVYYDPWYFDYFYYPYVVCRPFFYPIWYWGYYPCYRAWYWTTFYDPFYNPYYNPPYWWYDPYWWSSGYYSPYYRKNDFTRLRDNDGGRSGLRTAGGNVRDFNPNVSQTRSRLRDLEEGRVSTPSRNRERELYPREREDLRIPSSSERAPTLDRERIGTDRGTSTRESVRDRRDDRPNSDQKGTVRDKSPKRNPDRKDTPPPSIERRPERTPDRPNTSPPSIDRKPERTPDRRESSSTRRFDSTIPSLDREIKIERRVNDRSKRLIDNTQPKVDEPRNRYRSAPRIEYNIPPQETFTPRFEQNKRSNDNYRNDNEIKNEVPSRRSETPRYVPSSPPSYDPPTRRDVPRYNPPTYTPPPSSAPSNPAPSTDRRRD